MEDTSRKTAKIDKTEHTDDNLTGRGGLAFFVRYLNNIGIFSVLTGYFGDLRKSGKGLPAGDILRQILCRFSDGTGRHPSHSDEPARDAGYAGTVEQPRDRMASSHAIRRFAGSSGIFRAWLFRKVPHRLSVWRLRTVRPAVVCIDIDTMVMSSDGAGKREAVSPAYENTKGFQPLQVTRGRFVTDAFFRGGSCHSGHGESVVRIVTELANPIRGEHREDAVIVLTGDCGFPGQDLLAAFEKLGIFHAFGARVTENVRKAAASPTDGNFGELRKEKQAWRLADFGLIYGTWSVFRRLVFRQPLCEDGQMPLSPDRAETPIVTNIRSDTVAEDMPEEVRRLTDPAETPALCHGRGAAEPVFRSLRDFGFEETPLRRFAPDNALCYMMLAAFPLFEAFREDILSPVIPAESHAGTVRREFADIAAKIVSHANQIKLRFASAVFRRLNLSKIWDACKSPPRLC